MDQPLESNLQELSHTALRIQVIIRQLKSDQLFEQDFQEVSFQQTRTEYLEQALDLFKQGEEVLYIVKFKLSSEDVKDDIDSFVKYDALSERFNDLRVELRKAQLISLEKEGDVIRKQREKHFSNNYQVKTDLSEAKDDLFKASSKSESTFATKTFNDKLLDKNASITASLQKSRQLLEATVMESELNLEELETTTGNIQRLGTQYEFFNDMLIRTNGLVKEINKASGKERRDIYSALAFFCVCVVWVVWRRLLKRPVMLLLWTILKTMGLLRFLYGKSTSSTPEVIPSIRDVTGTILTSTIEEWDTLATAAATFGSMNSIAG